MTCLEPVAQPFAKGEFGAGRVVGQVRQPEQHQLKAARPARRRGVAARYPQQRRQQITALIVAQALVDHRQQVNVALRAKLPRHR